MLPITSRCLGSNFPIFRQVVLVVRVHCRVTRTVCYPRLHRKYSSQRSRSSVRSGTPARQLEVDVSPIIKLVCMGGANSLREWPLTNLLSTITREGVFSTMVKRRFACVMVFLFFLIDISDRVEHNFSRAVLSTGITGRTSGTVLKL